MSYVRCICGTVYDTVGTTTGMSGCCPKCGLHHSGQYRVVKPVLKPSPLAAKPIDATEIVRCRDCKHVKHTPEWQLDRRYKPEDAWWCHAEWCEGMGGDHPCVEPDGFCKWGERK